MFSFARRPWERGDGGSKDAIQRSNPLKNQGKIISQISSPGVACAALSIMLSFDHQVVQIFQVSPSKRADVLVCVRANPLSLLRGEFSQSDSPRGPSSFGVSPFMSLSYPHGRVSRGRIILSENRCRERFPCSGFQITGLRLSPPRLVGLHDWGSPHFRSLLRKRYRILVGKSKAVLKIAAP